MNFNTFVNSVHSAKLYEKDFEHLWKTLPADNRRKLATDFVSSDVGYVDAKTILRLFPELVCYVIASCYDSQQNFS